MDAITRPARSWLFVPAMRPEQFAKAAASGADRVIIDLEDAVAEAAKTEARAKLAGAPLPQDVPLYIRVNGCTTQWFEEDLALVASLPVAGIVLPKAESADDVERAASELSDGQVIVPIIETAAGLWQVLEIARALRVERLAFGALDFQIDTGIRAAAPDEIELAYARARIVLASRVAGINGALDSVSTTLDDQEQISRDAMRARRFGFAGKLCIHPKQIAVVNHAYLPTEQEVDWARSLMAALAANPAHQRSAFSHQGRMVDRPVIEHARELLAADDLARR